MKKSKYSASNLRHLRIFTSVGTLGSQHLAARAEGLSQPAVSQAISSVETLFATHLFRRSRSGMQLNKAGEAAFGRLTRMFTLLRQINTDSGALRHNAFDNRLTMAHLKTLVAVVSTKGFTAAAKNLDLAVPTVHRATRNLEKLVGAPLIERSGANFEPTLLGEELARISGLALRELEAAFEDVDDLRGRLAGRISLGALPLARSDILPNAIGDLCDKNPRASVDLMSADYDTLLRSLRHGALDLLLGASRGKHLSADISEIILFEDSLSVFARAGHPLAGKPSITIDQLARYPWIAPHLGTPTRTDFDSLFGALDLPQGLISTSSLVVIRSLLARSDRLTLLSRRRLLYEEQQGLLVALDISLPTTARTICISIRTGWQPTRLQREFLKILTQPRPQHVADKM
ncbi:MAG: LysR family transcriptional regulator [Rhodobacteraceae bacterium]|nr:LysR family transcriptional regulator [Paracoccaceae bacterium]